jgi:hypothetical protein
MSNLKTFFKLPRIDQLLVLEAFILLGLARAAVLSLPFRWLAYFLGEKKSSLKEKDSLEEEPPPPKARHIGWALRLMSQHTPWESNCLAKAVAGRFMLKRRKLSATLYFGMTKGADGKLEAHAWLKSGRKILTGDSDLDQYSVVAIFSD